MKLPEKIKFKKNILGGLSLARSIHFTAQGALLRIMDQLLNSRKARSFADIKNNLQQAFPKAQAVIQKDVQAMVEGYYPESVLFHESPLSHFARIPQLIADAYRATQQRKNKESKKFDEPSSEFLREMPDYYQRNFHFQKDGYLSEESADLYEHQVEVLFAGSAQAMRRQVLIPFKKHFGNSPVNNPPGNNPPGNNQGEGLKILEIGCGTGALTRNLALSFPKAQITALDLSPQYISHAKKKHTDLVRVNWVQGRGEDLDYRDQTFDAVVSCYLFHELPEKIRSQILKEKLRVLKSGGFIAVVDSIQHDDDPTLNWALEEFPKDFHEPFYKDYVHKKLESTFSEIGVQNIQTNLAFLTKIVTGKKFSEKVSV
jgi:ubiquinone/menaquinone biosynthesis C-methylase UbiE